MKRPPLTDNDGEIRELALENFKGLRPLSETDPGMIDSMKAMRNKGGRPKVDAPKVQIGFRLAADLVDGIKATGKGFNTRVEQVLRDALATGKLNADRDLLDQPKR